jgi:hypothetical protein
LSVSISFWASWTSGSVQNHAVPNRVLNLLNEELTLTMKLAGCARLDDITSDLLYPDPIFRTVGFNGDRAKPEPKR